MQNRDLTTLRTIARTGSFREAAERLNMTLSAVSMQMKALEASLDGALFDRSVRPPRLTALGRAVAEAAGHVLEAERRLRALAGPKAALTGRFRLGLVASAGPRLLPAFLRHRPDAFPEADFTFSTGLSETLDHGVETGELDAAVLTAIGVPAGGLRHRVLHRDRLMRAGQADLPPDRPFLQFAPSTGIGRLIAAALPDHPDLSRRPRLILDHVATIRACLTAGLGTTILPEVDLPGIAATPIGRDRTLVLSTRIGTPLDEVGDRLAELLQDPGA
ncbi:MAG: LysR family transcriptional regulator [Pseudomonadota bacterium]